MIIPVGLRFESPLAPNSIAVTVSILAGLAAVGWLFGERLSVAFGKIFCSAQRIIAVLAVSVAFALVALAGMMFLIG